MPNVESIGGCMSASYRYLCFLMVENGVSVVVSNGNIYSSSESAGQANYSQKKAQKQWQK